MRFQWFLNHTSLDYLWTRWDWKQPASHLETCQAARGMFALSEKWNTVSVHVRASVIRPLPGHTHCYSQEDSLGENKTLSSCCFCWWTQQPGSGTLVFLFTSPNSRLFNCHLQVVIYQTKTNRRTQKDSQMYFGIIPCIFSEDSLMLFRCTNRCFFF